VIIDNRSTDGSFEKLLDLADSRFMSSGPIKTAAMPKGTISAFVMPESASIPISSSWPTPISF
jgi:hypothetical protein